jgi:hypothetical protein
VVPVKKGLDGVPVPSGLRVGRLLSLESYLEWAILGMWALPERSDALLGMAEASLRAPDPGDPELDLLETLRNLVREAREHHAHGRFSPAMARMRVAADLVSLRIINLSATARGE